MTHWTLPSEDLLPLSTPGDADHEEAERRGRLITERLDLFGARAEVERITVGPVVTKYELMPSEGLSVRKLPALAPDLAFELGAESVRVLAPIPGRRAIGIEVPTPDRRTVLLRDVLDAVDSPLTFALGVDGDGHALPCDLPDLPHLLIAGCTGSGKSVALNSMLCALLMGMTPDELGLVLIDPKMVELGHYESIPHLLQPVVGDPEEAANALDWLVEEMQARYRFLEREGARSLDEFNRRALGEPLPAILCVVDELADLMMVARADVERSIVRLAQKARAVGIHLVLATQSPRVAVVTGLIKANVPSRIAFTTAQAIDSRVILDRNGAQDLLGRGDGLGD